MPKLKTFNPNQVLNDAMELFWKNGFHKTSIQELVHNLGVNRVNLYNRYSDKEELYKQSFSLYKHNIKQNIDRIFKNAKNTCHVCGFGST